MVRRWVAFRPIFERAFSNLRSRLEATLERWNEPLQLATLRNIMDVLRDRPPRWPGLGFRAILCSPRVYIWMLSGLGWWTEWAVGDILARVSTVNGS